MRYGTSLLFAGILTLCVCGAALAAQPGFTDHNGIGLAVELPSAWKPYTGAPFAEIQKGMADVKLLFAAEGDGQNFPILYIWEQKDPDARARPVSVSEAKTWCDVLQNTYKKELGDSVKDFSCGRSMTQSGYALSMEMTLPSNDSGPMVNVSWTLPRSGVSVLATAMFPKTDAARVLSLVKKTFESIQLAK